MPEQQPIHELDSLPEAVAHDPDNQRAAKLGATNMNPVDRLRTICLALPEVTERGGVGDPTFRVRDKIFAMQHGVAGRASMWFKAPRGFQGMIVSSDSDRFFVPPYVGHHGWVGAWLDVELDWDEVEDLVRESYRMTAPKRLLALLDQSSRW